MGIFQTNSELGKVIADFPSRWNAIEASIAEALGLPLDQQFTGKQVISSSDLDANSGVVKLDTNGKIPLGKLNAASSNLPPNWMPITQSNGKLDDAIIARISALRGRPKTVLSAVNTRNVPGDGILGGYHERLVDWSTSIAEFTCLQYNPSVGSTEIVLASGAKYLVILTVGAILISATQPTHYLEVCTWVENILNGTRSAPHPLIQHSEAMYLDGYGLYGVVLEACVGKLVDCTAAPKPINVWTIVRDWMYPFDSQVMSVSGRAMGVIFLLN